MTGLRYVSQISFNGHSFYLRIYTLRPPKRWSAFISTCSPVSLLYGGSLHTIFLITVVAHFVSRPVWTLGLSPRNIN